MRSGDIKTELREHTEFNETVLWAAQPKQGILFSPLDIFLIPFSLVWCGFSIFWVIMAAKASVLFALFGVPFVLIGLLMVFGRFILSAKLRKNTYYGITKTRIIIYGGIRNKQLKSLDIQTLDSIEFIEKADGTGYIVFGKKNPNAVWGSGLDWIPGAKTSPMFEGIPDVKKVYNLIVGLQNENNA